MNNAPAIHIDFDRVLGTLKGGIHRADIFMGLGLNAAENDPPISHVLAPSGLHQINLVKEELDEGEQLHVAEEFGKWIRANGMRELLESFSVYLHELYEAVFLIHSKNGAIKSLSLIRPNRFERMGIGDQITEFSKALNIIDNDILIVKSLNQARNCYAHRRGRVGQKDIDAESGELKLCWTTFQIQIEEPNGNVISEQEMFGKVLKDGGNLQLQVVIREKAFALDNELIIEKQELKEMCLCILSIGERIFKEAVDLARKAGVLSDLQK